MKLFVLDKVLRFLITSFLAVLGAALLYPARHILTEYIGEELAGVSMGILEITVTGLLCIVIGAVLGGIIGYFSSSYLIRQLKRFSSWVETQLSKMSAVEIVVGVLGLALGLLIILSAKFPPWGISSPWFSASYSVTWESTLRRNDAATF